MSNAPYRQVISDAALSPEDEAAVLAETTRILHREPGWRPSDAAREALRRFEPTQAAARVAAVVAMDAELAELQAGDRERSRR